MDDKFESEIAQRVKAARKEADHKKRMALGAFAQIQFAMYEANHVDFNSHTIRKLEEEVKNFLGILDDLKSTEDHALVTMSPVDHNMGIGTGVTPAELEGARVRSEQAAANGE